MQQTRLICNKTTPIQHRTAELGFISTFVSTNRSLQFQRDQAGSTLLGNPRDRSLMNGHWSALPPFFTATTPLSTKELPFLFATCFLSGHLVCHLCICFSRCSSEPSHGAELRPILCAAAPRSGTQNRTHSHQGIAVLKLRAMTAGDLPGNMCLNDMWLGEWLRSGGLILELILEWRLSQIDHNGSKIVRAVNRHFS